MGISVRMDLIEKYDSFKDDCKEYRRNKTQFKLPDHIKGIYEK